MLEIWNKTDKLLKEKSETKHDPNVKFQVEAYNTFNDNCESHGVKASSVLCVLTINFLISVIGVNCDAEIGAWCWNEAVSSMPAWDLPLWDETDMTSLQCYLHTMPDALETHSEIKGKYLLRPNLYF